MSLKLLIVGDGGTGKSSYVKKLLKEGFIYSYVNTLGVENYTIIYKNRHFDIWDTSGQEKFSGLKEGYYIGSDCAIIMLSDNQLTLKSLSLYRNKIKNICGDIPIVVLFNKSDLPKTMENYKLLKKYSNIENVMHCSFGPIDRFL